MPFVNRQSELFHLWSRQLQREFHDINWRYKLNLSLPLFEIFKAKKRYGSWDPNQRIIRISSVLIENFSWDIVIQILKHEIAHQICSEIFCDASGGHGRNFHRACDLLGLAPEFRLAGGDLPQGFISSAAVDQQTDKGRRFIKKISKLLALAQSANEHEANLAMTKAGELMDKYNLRQLEDDSSQGYGYLIINLKKKRTERYQRQICRILQEFFYVKIVFSSLYDSLLDTEHNIIELLGRRENIEVAEYIYFFLENKLKELWQQNRTRFRGNATRARNSYYSGLLAGFYDKLEQQNQNLKKHSVYDHYSSNTSALVVAEDQQLQNFIGNRYPRLCCRSRQKATIYRDSYDRGVEDGAKIVINKGVGGDDGNLGRLLE